MKLIQLRDQFRWSLKEIYTQAEIDDLCKRSIGHLFGWEPIKIGLDPHYLLSTKEESMALKWLMRLRQGEPLQYLIGKVDFMGLSLLVSPAVLIPRPETAELVAWILVQESGKEHRVLDLCTGSGCIALGLKSKHPTWEIEAIELSPKALEVAQLNSKQLGLSIRYHSGDVLSCNLPKATYSLMVSNPPYVLPSEQAMMHVNVLDYEPHLALFIPEEDPLLFYRKILEQARHSLTEKGCLYFEINPRFKEPLILLAKKNGFSIFQAKNDIFGKTRMLQFTKD